MNILKADILVFLTLLHYSRKMFLVPSLAVFQFLFANSLLLFSSHFFTGKLKQIDETCTWKERTFCVVLEICYYLEEESEEMPEYAYFSTWQFLLWYLSPKISSRACSAVKMISSNKKIHFQLYNVISHLYRRQILSYMTSRNSKHKR